jgi:hypothetical protein
MRRHRSPTSKGQPMSIIDATAQAASTGDQQA